MIVVFGAGAVGGCIAARLALAGEDVALFARGPALDAARSHGLRLREQGGEHAVRIRATDDPAEVRNPRALLVCSKAYSLGSAAPTLTAIMGPHTALVPVQNGIPWWYFHRAGGPFEGQAVRAVDHHGILLRDLPPERVIGCVVYLAASAATPAVIELSMPGRLVLGEPDGRSTPRLEFVAAALARGGFDVAVTDRIREAIWMKLWGNLPLNSVSALTLASVQAMLDDPGLRGLLVRVMEEMRSVAAATGVPLAMGTEQRLEQARRLGAFKTSMLQDLEAGRPLEVDALIGAVSELGRRAKVPTVAIDTLECLLRMRAAAAGR